MKEVIKQSTDLYYEIDDCITKLLKARLDKDSNKENEALYQMEGLMVETMQHLSWLVGELKGNSQIKWQTGEPKERGWYLATCKSGEPESFVALVYCDGSKWNASLGRNLRKEVIIESWVKISTIEPCKFNSIQK